MPQISRTLLPQSAGALPAGQALFKSQLTFQDFKELQFLVKKFPRGEEYGDQQNKLGNKRVSYYPNTGAGRLLTSFQAFCFSGDKGLSEHGLCECPQVPGEGATRIETPISLKIYPVTLGLATYLSLLILISSSR